MRVVTWDSDVETEEIARRARAIGATVVNRKRAASFMAALLIPTELLVVITHGSPDGDYLTGKFSERLPIANVIPSLIDCHVVVVLACHQRNSEWLSRVAPGTIVVTSNDYVSTAALKWLVPALAGVRSIAGVRGALASAGRRCSTLRKRTWEITVA